MKRLLFLCLILTGARSFGDVCVVCEKELRGDIFTWKDKVTQTKSLLCHECTLLPDNCYLCSLPVLRNFKELSDGRVLCKRDSTTVVLDENVASAICAQVQELLDRQFVRFISFPQTNVQIGTMDRVTLQEMYKVIGNDFSCPNTLGCTKTVTNNNSRAFEISILSGQPREDLITTCVHELTHTWIIENSPTARSKTIGKDAVEGFCELVSYRYAEAHGLLTGMTNILSNHYTRGQIHLFIKADSQFGFDQVVDWMKWGEDALLRTNDLGRLRRLEMPTRIATVVTVTKTNSTTDEVVTTAPAPVKHLPTHLVLQGIIWSETKPVVTINGINLERGDETTIELVGGKTLVRCLEIRSNAAVVQTNHSAESVVLELK